MYKKLFTIIFLTLIILSLSLVGCASLTSNNQSMIVLPAEPQKRVLEIEAPYNTADYMTVIVYQDNMISEWELWAIEVQKTVDTLNKLNSIGE